MPITIPEKKPSALERLAGAFAPIGTVIGGTIGSLVPGAGTAAGASLGGALGGAAAGVAKKNPIQALASAAGALPAAANIAGAGAPEAGAMGAMQRRFSLGDWRF